MLIHTLSQILDAYQPQEWIDIINASIATRDSNHTSEQRLAALHKRDVEFNSRFWALSQISTPPFYDWYNNEDIRQEGVIQGIIYKYYFHSSRGEDQYIYIVEDGIWPDHPVN